MDKIIEQPFRLTNSDPVITAANGVANRWSDVWKYQVPAGSALLLKPEHTFSAYLKDAGAEVGNSTCSVKIEKRDSSGSDILVVYGPDLYLASKEFQDVEKKARLKIPYAEFPNGIVVNAREFLVITVLDDANGVVADSYFELHISRVRKTLNA